MFTFSKASIRNMDGVNECLREIASRAIQITLVDFGIPQSGGYRTIQEQAKLFADGKSNCDGYIKKSKHQLGKALDFYAYVDGKANWDKENMAMVACAFLQAASELGYYIKWGGLWKRFRDMPHIELNI